MKNRIMVMIMAAVFALPAMAGWINQEQKDATAQQNAFQSTSTMQGSGSAYSSTPSLNEDGTANNPAAAPIGKRRAPNPINDDKDWEDRKNEVGSGVETPIGDAVLPLMLMAAAGAGIIALRRRRAVIGK